MRLALVAALVALASVAVVVADDVPPQAITIGLEDQLAGVADKVAELRELAFTTTPVVTYLSGAELATRVRGFSDEYTVEDADRDTRILVALGAIPDGFDLKAALIATLEEQVAGFYDPETGELVVGSKGDRLRPLDELVLAHELNHALIDQALELPALDSEEVGAEDALFAQQALVEGDASSFETEYLNFAFGPITQLQLAGQLLSVAGDLRVLGSMPHYLQRSLLFPYIEGAAFVGELRRQGGWAAVNEAYQHLPTTTAQILFPNRYRDRIGAIDARDPIGPGAGWDFDTWMAFGAADLLFLIEAPGNSSAASLDQPVRRAAAWAGGEMHVWTRGQDTALAVIVVRQTPEDDMCETLIVWYRATAPSTEAEAVGDETFASDGLTRDASIKCDDLEVRIGIAPDLATARVMTK